MYLGFTFLLVSCYSPIEQNGQSYNQGISADSVDFLSYRDESGEEDGGGDSGIGGIADNPISDKGGVDDDGDDRRGGLPPTDDQPEAGRDDGAQVIVEMMVANQTQVPAIVGRLMIQEWALHQVPEMALKKLQLQ